MDVFEFAMKMEIDGRNFYKAAAADCSDNDLKQILLTLADEEQSHFLFFKRMRDGETDQAAGELQKNSKTLNKVKNIFSVMAEDKNRKSLGEDALSVWNKALRIEEEAAQFYSEEADLESNPGIKELLLLIAGEERNHIHMISGVISYLKFPDQFAASSQFKDFQSLEGH